MRSENREAAVSIARQPRVRGRVGDRRAGIAGVLASLLGGGQHVREASSFQHCLERELARVVPISGVNVRETEAHVLPGPSSVRLGVFDAPSLRADRRVRLEVTLGATARLDAWDRQLLQTAAYLTALVVEIDRLRGGASRRVASRGQRDAAAPLIGASGVMQRMRERIERVARTDFSVLVEGESGSGKELVARQIHELSGRRTGPFVAVNCAAIVDTLLEAELFGIEDRTATGVRGRRGKFEQADGGTLFLDEVSDLSASAQAKLLRALQEMAIERVGGHATHIVDTRIIVATNRALRGMVAQGSFRADLFYRLNGVEIQVPPLRARTDDITELAAYFLARHRGTRTLELSATARDALRTYGWPGNVRELQRVMERAIALSGSDRIGIEDLPSEVRQEYCDVLLPSMRTDDTLRAWGSRYARLVLDRCGNNKRLACERLGISYHTLQAYLRYPSRRRREDPAPEG